MANAIPDFPSFQRSLAGTPMAGEARGIYNAAIKGGINPAFVVGLAMSESSGGKAGYAVGTHNPFGLGVHQGWKFNTYADATSKLASTLHGLGYPDLYKKSGIRGVIGQYTPFGDASNNPNSHTTNIEQYGNRTGGNAAQVYINGGAPVAGGAPASGIAASPTATPDYSKIISMARSQMDNMRNGGRYDRTAGQSLRDAVVGMIGSKNIGGGAVSPDAISGAPAAGYSGYPLGKRGQIIGTPYSGTHTLGNWESDNAVDVGVPVGTPVYAVANGSIGSQFGALGSNNPRMAGLRLHLNSGGGHEYYYAHLSKFAPGIKPGSQVAKGQLLGYSGSANGTAHLHFGATTNDDPRNYFK